MADVSEVQSEAYEIGKELLQSVAHWCDDELKKYESKDQLLVVRMAVLALNQYATMLAVDTGMTEEQYLEINSINFREALAKAPHFG